MGHQPCHPDLNGAGGAWVDSGIAPDRIVAEPGPGTPWPGRTRPLCPYPQQARYNGSGSLESADSFSCLLRWDRIAWRLKAMPSQRIAGIRVRRIGNERFPERQRSPRGSFGNQGAKTYAISASASY